MRSVRCIVATTGRERAPAGDVAVVVDVLRASTTITTALELGAAAVVPTASVDDALALARKRSALLIGERGNEKVPGFDLGNSPARLTDAVHGRAIVFTSTNFPRAVAAAGGCGGVLVGCLRNLTAVVRAAAERAARREGAGICVVLAGNLPPAAAAARESGVAELTDAPPQARAEEDMAFAGAAALALREEGWVAEGLAAEAALLVGAAGAEAMVRRSAHAAVLERQGFGDDVVFASAVDATRVVGVLRDGEITAAER